MHILLQINVIHGLKNCCLFKFSLKPNIDQVVAMSISAWSVAEMLPSISVFSYYGMQISFHLSCQMCGICHMANGEIFCTKSYWSSLSLSTYTVNTFVTKEKNVIARLTPAGPACAHPSPVQIPAGAGTSKWVPVAHPAIERERTTVGSAHQSGAQVYCLI